MKKSGKGTKNSCVFYRSMLDATSQCGLAPDEELAVLKGLILYALDGCEPQLEGAAKAIFLCSKPVIDANTQRYEVKRRGGAPLGNKNAAGPHRKRTKTANNLSADEERETPSMSISEECETTSRAYEEVDDDVNAEVDKEENEEMKKENDDADVAVYDDTLSTHTTAGGEVDKSLSELSTASYAAATPSLSPTSPPTPSSAPQPTTLTPQQQYEKRKQAFIAQIRPYVLHNSPDLLNDFFLYWAVPDQRTWRMRWENEQYWDLDMRITDFLRMKEQQKQQMKARRHR